MVTTGWTCPCRLISGSQPTWQYHKFKNT